MQCCAVRMCRRRSCADALAAPQTLRFSRTVLHCCRCVRQIKYVIVHTCMLLPPMPACMPRLGAHGFAVWPTLHIPTQSGIQLNPPTRRAPSPTRSARSVRSFIRGLYCLAHTCVHSLAVERRQSICPTPADPPPSIRPHHSLARSTPSSRVCL